MRIVRHLLNADDIPNVRDRLSFVKEDPQSASLVANLDPAPSFLIVHF